jgi:prophage regulatory protein
MPIDSTPPELILAEEIAQRIPYSQNHLRRLEATGNFPKRVRIGANRVAWVRREVDDWLMERINERLQNREASS